MILEVDGVNFSNITHVVVEDGVVTYYYRKGGDDWDFEQFDVEDADKIVLLDEN